ncbi:hypothetical protein AC579_10567 [Pseudocercospora musae]|uniref:F-box domain-containing protein n=1 Tax=Pseudocercospora musae TaxID=113226 RepID=A0A139GZT4_9PEZI|nr:hypothetical protein AC579_10567 [Pseudocercospora musae]KXS95649.1 hypothetical protein AC579_10567 [Pseudocercospora musae]
MEGTEQIPRSFLACLVRDLACAASTLDSCTQNIQSVLSESLRNILIMAAATVFALPELLENIILSLPLRSILTAKQVSKTFCGTIDTSIWIRRALFLEPATNGRAAWSRQRAGGDRSGPVRVWADQNDHVVTPILNPFIAVMYDEDFDELYRKQWYHAKENGLYLGLNEVFTLAMGEEEERILHFESDHDDKSDLVSKLRKSTSSFRRMMITSPPIIELSIDDNSVESQSDSGLTIDDLLDAALALSGVDENENDFEIEGGEACRVLAKTVDEITGWEMLRIFLLDDLQLGHEAVLLDD